MTNTNLIVIFGPGYLSTTAGPFFTCPQGIDAVQIQRVTVNNHSTAAANLFIYLVRSGDTVGNPQNTIVGIPSTGLAVTSGPSEPYVINSMASAVLKPGDALYGAASVNNALTIYGSGWQIASS